MQKKFLKRQAGSVKPQLPNDTRWKSQLTCLNTFINNRYHYATIAIEHPDEVTSSVSDKIMNIAIYQQAKDLAEQLRPIATALSITQSDNTTIADSCHLFLSLLNEPSLEPHKAAVTKRLSKAIEPCHLAAYLLHPSHLSYRQPNSG